MVYPVIYAGQRITEDLLTSMLPLEVRKAADETVTSSTAMQDDNVLTLELAASAVYEVVFELVYGAETDEDIRTEWSVPSGATGFKGVHGPGSTVGVEANADNVNMRSGVHGFTTDIIYSGTRSATVNTLDCYAREWGIVTTTNAGTLVLRWAQGTSGATGTILTSASYLRARRIG